MPAGRPSVDPSEKRLPRSVSLPAWMWAALDAEKAPGVSASALVEWALMSRYGWQPPVDDTLSRLRAEFDF